MYIKVPISDAWFRFNLILQKKKQQQQLGGKVCDNKRNIMVHSIPAKMNGKE
jgi:hypothetical protein